MTEERLDQPLGIAVVGMVGRFPDAPDLETYWHNLDAGHEAIRRLTDEELAALGVPEADRRHPEFVRAGALLADVDLFDAGFFGYSPREAATTDPQQRVFLECAWEALEHAGIDPSRYGGLIGVYAGAGANSYLLFNLAGHGLGRRELLQLMIGSDKDFVATRVSYKLDLKGPSLDVQTACSTSLVAVHLAFHGLLSYQCDVAIAGGVSIQVPSLAGYYHEQGSIFSPDGRCRAFDQAASGTVFGSGAGAVVLKRLDEAIEDGDTIHAVIRGTAINNDGAAKLGFTAPSTEGQARVIELAQAVADVEPETISYVEAHGTGTALGDPIEVSALHQVFGPGRGPGTCALGSVKTQVGHLDTAAGMAGLIKTVLALEHGTIPPTLHFERANPQIDFGAGPFYVPTEPTPWTPVPGVPRRAGVSAFGVGGTNAHVVLEEAPARPVASASKPGQLLVLSARSEAALARAAGRLADHLEEHPEQELADVARTLQLGRKAFPHRRAVSVADRADAAAALRDGSRGATSRAGEARPEIAFLLPGQGSQHPGMARELYRAEPAFARQIDRGAAVLEPLLGVDVRTLLWPEGDASDAAARLTRTRFAQPTLYLVEHALATLWREHGVEPRALLGHSLGELTAAALAGVVSFEDGLKLAAHRGRLMDSAPAGGMAAVALPAAEVEELLAAHPELCLAAVNAPASCAVAGPVAAIEAWLADMDRRGVAGRRLHTSHAFHSPAMDEAAAGFAEVVAGVPLSPARLPFVSNVTGTWITDEQATDPAYWGQQLRATARFSDGVAALLETSGRVLLEVGPGRALTALAQKHRQEEERVTAVASLPAPDEPAGADRRRWLHALGALWTVGAEPEWERLYEGERRYKVPLPTYPFDRHRYWIYPPSEAPTQAGLPEVAAQTSGTPAVERSSPETSPFESDTERRVAALWRELLGVERVRPEDDFFELGGDSLLGTRVATWLRGRYGIELPLADLFAASTVRALARQVDEARTAEPPAETAEPLSRDRPLPLSFAQERMWFLHRLDPADSRYHLPAAVELEGELLPAALAQALGLVAARHEPLRTVFVDLDGTPAQEIRPPGPPAPLPVADLSRLPEPARSAEAGRLEKAEVRRPFDLGAAPGERSRLLRLTAGGHRLLVTLHHAVSDGWSTGILVRETAGFYQALHAGTPAAAPSLPRAYADWAAEERRRLDGAEGERLLGWWRERLAGAPQVLELPADHSRSNQAGFAGRRLPLGFSRDETAALERLARRHGSTLFGVLLAGFGGLLSRLTGQRDLVLGAPVAGRTQPGVEGLIGLFVNTLALRLDAAGDPGFGAFLARTGETVVQALEHQELPFERLVAELVAARDASVPPLVQVLLSFQEEPPQNLTLPGLAVRAREVHDGGARFDLTLFLTSGPAGLTGYLETRRGLFEATTGKRLAGQLARLLAAAAADPDLPLSALPLLSAAELHQVAREWAGPTAPCPAFLLHERFFEQASRRPDAVAVVDGDRALTYGELAARARSLAARLAALGAGPESVVGLDASRSAEAVVGIVGILAASAAYLPLDPDYPEERVAFALADAGASVVVRGGEVDEVDRVDRVEKVDGADLPLSAAAYVIYTSGSTGRPKGVVVGHGNASRLLTAAARDMDFDQTDVWSLFHSTAFDFSVWEIWGALLSGGKVVVVPYETSRSPRETRRLLAEERVTVLSQTPSAFRGLQEVEIAEPAEPLPLRLVVFGGEALDPSSLIPWWSRYEPSRPRLVNMYGITETTVHVTFRPIVPADTGSAASPLGRPLADLSLHLLDPASGRPVPPGAVCEIVVGGAGLARGYLGRPALTAERFVPDPWGAAGGRLYKSGDLGRFRTDGDLLYLGRLDQQVQLRGFRVELGEIEAVLAAHPAVAAAVVVAPAEGAGGRAERLAAWVRPAGEPVAAGELRAWAAERLPGYMVPPLFFVRDALPLTPSGKVDRKALAQAALSEAPDGAGDAGYVAPRGPVAEIVAGVWQEVLGVERVGMADDFFALGGHSLLATRVVSRLEAALGARVPVALLFEAPTLAELAGRLTEAGPEAPPRLPAVARRSRPEALPLSPAQTREWFLDRLTPGNPAYHVSTALAFDGRLAVPRLAQAMSEVVRRHETLRTAFPLVDGEPVQVVLPARAASLPVVDLSALPAPAAESQARILAAASVARPFDLAAGPVFRWALLRLGAGLSVLSWVIHHVAADGWSVGVLTREVKGLEDAFAAGAPSHYPELPVQYADYTLAQLELLESADGERLTEAWRRRLTPLPAPLELPADRPRRPGARSRPGWLSFPVPIETMDGVRALGRRQGASPFMVLAAVLAAHLARLTGARDLILGTFVAGRERPEIEPLVGFFVNSLPLPVDLSGDPTFAALLGRVRETTLFAYAHQALPFERLLAGLDVERSLTRTPLFQAMLVLQNHPKETVELDGLPGRPFTPERPDTGLDLTWWAVEADCGLEVTLEYAADVFDGTTARRWAKGWKRLLGRALEEPEVPVADLPALSAAEGHQVAREWTEGETLTPRPWLATFLAVVRETPDRVSVVDVEDGASLTYGELWHRSETLASSLRAQGIRPDDRVGVELPRSPELIVSILAVHAAGAAWVPLDPKWPEERRRRMAEDAALVLTVTAERGRGWAPRTERSAKATACSEHRPQEPPAAPAEGKVEPESAAYVIYTSGSTGRPKGVVVPRQALSWYAAAATRHYRITADDRVLQFSSPSFDAAIEEIFPTLGRGATLVLRDDEMAASVAAFHRRVAEHGVTVASTPTAFWHLLAEEGAPSEGLPPSLRQVILGGERLLPERLASWQQAPGTERIELVNTYGPTEATVVATLEPLAGAAADRDVPIGRPVPGARAYVADAVLSPSAPGTPSELLLGGPGVARGYLGRPAATAAAFLPDPFSPEPGARLYATGDRARFLADGRIGFLGRLDSQLKIRGFRVEPGEVENVLTRHPEVAEAAVVARGEGPARSLAAFVTLVPSSSLPGSSDLRAWLAEHLPEHMVPRVVTVLPELPRTPAGKLDRRRLADLPIEESSPAGAYAAPRTATEEVLAGIWAECLEVERVGVNDDFFALGGYSLLLTQVTARVRQAFGVDLPLAAFFEAPTVEALARELEARSGPPLPPIERQPRDGELPTSFAQERLWFLAQLDPESGSYHVPRVLRLAGALSPTALDEAYLEVTRRQEVLRTTFPARGGRPMQRIHPPPARFPLPRVDLSGLSPDDREGEAGRHTGLLAGRTFDLERGPLIRVFLLRLAPGLHRLIQNEHHLVHDGWTEGVLLEDVTLLYRAYALGEPSPLPELPFQFADFAVWQRRWLTGEVLERQVAYWRGHLEGAPPLLELPTDRPRPQVLSSRGDARNFRLSPELSERIARLARGERATTFMAMLAAFQVVLARWSRQEDLVIGTAAANRRHREVERVVGMVINTLALRTDVSGDPRFVELVDRVRQVCLGAYAHEDLPFEKVVEAVAPERTLAYHPLFQVEFAFHDARQREIELPGLAISGEAAHNRTTKWDLLYIVLPPDGLRRETIVHAEWSSDLFDATTMERMFGQYVRALEAVAADSALPLSEVPLLSAAELHQVAREWPGPTVETGPFLLHERFFEVADAAPTAPALVDGERVLTYGELAGRSRRLAARLASLGAGPEAIVGLHAGRSAEAVVGIVGILAAGAAYLPLDPAYPPERLAFALDDSGATLVVTTASEQGAVPDAPGRRLVVLGEVDEVDRVDRVDMTPKAAAYVIYTSGSTGRPKGVVVSHANASRLISVTQPVFGYGPGDAWSLFHSTAFDFSVWEIWGALSTGGRVVVVPYLTSRSPTETYRLLAREGVTMLSQTPSAFLQLQEAERFLPEPPPLSLRWVVFGGEALEPASLAPWVERHGDGTDGAGPVLVNMYGITETTVHVTWKTLTRDDVETGGGSRIGRPLADLSVALADPRTGEPVPVGVPGEILVGGAGPARGYLGRPALTAERFTPAPGGGRLYRSGDLARFRADGELDYLGRIDHQVQLRGFRVELGEIEAALAAHPGVAAAVVVPAGDGGRVERLAAWVVHTETEAPEVSELREHLARRLPSYMVPSLFFAVGELPSTPSGKVDRRALERRSVDASGAERTRAPHVPPATPTAKKLAAIWRDLLGVERVGMDDDFFALGGHSLIATQVLHRVEEELGVQVPLRRLFEVPTLAQLEAAVTEAQVLATGEDELLAMLAQLEEA